MTYSFTDAVDFGTDDNFEAAYITFYSDHAPLASLDPNNGYANKYLIILQASISFLDDSGDAVDPYIFTYDHERFEFTVKDLCNSFKYE